jgi:ribose transport system substrate-binding protein
MLTKNPDIDAIFAYNDPSALGAAAVLKGAGKDAWSGDKEGIIVIGINATADAIDAIKSGVMTATYDPNSAQAGAAAVAALALVIKDKKPSSAMPKKIVIKTKRWDIDNADEYVEPFKREITLPEVK